MGLPMAALAVALAVLSLASSHHIPGHQGNQLPSHHLPGFERGAVEHRPIQTLDDEQQPEYGSSALPLRSAVESIPEHYENHRQPLRDAVEATLKHSVRRQPLRDAVEHRLPPSRGGIDHMSFWLEELTPPAVRNTRNKPNVLCHLEAEAAYREEPFSLLPRALPPHKCSHLIYSAASIDPQEFTVISRDPEYDIVKGGYKAATGLRRQDPALRVLLSIASPDHGRLYRELLAGSEERLPVFIDSLITFLEDHDFDGVEIDWENASTSSLKFLLRHVRDALQSRGYSILVTLRPEQTADSELAQLADLLVLRAWHSRRVPEVVQSPAPLPFVISFVEDLTRRGVPPAKIVVGLPFFGWSYKLANKDDGETPLVATGFGVHGQYTKHKGQLAYYEICEKLEDTWQFRRHEKNGSYLILGDQWIGYDDPISVKIKAAYVKSASLGGVSLYSLDLDDFQGICGDSWPLLTGATRTLGILDGPKEKCPKTGLYSDPDNCSGFLSCFNGELYRGHCGIGRFYDPVRGRCVRASPEVCDPGHSDKFSYANWRLERLRQRQRLEKLELLDDGPRVVCYVTSWAMYRKGQGKFVPEHLDARLCTDVVYAFAGLNPESLTVHSFDPWADIENNLYQRITSIAGARVLLGLGGWTDSAGDKYSRLVSSASSRRKFVASAVHFLRKHNFQGLSFEWNYPVCWQSDCRRGSASDRPNFTRLLAELRREFDQQEPKLTLAVGISGYKEVIDKAYEIAEISKLTDFMTVMTYDYHGAWESTTSHLAPLFAIPGDTNPYYSLNYTLNYLVNLGADRSKIIAGIPMYGQSYRLSSPDKSGLNDPVTGPGSAGEYTRQPGMLAYHEICERIEKENWQLGPGPSAHSGNQFVSFDNPKSIAYKGEYLLKYRFGGAAAWTVDLDDFTNRCCQEPFPLLRSINRALGRLLTPAPSHKDCKKPDEPVTPVAPTLTTHADANDGKPVPTKPMFTPSTKPTTWPTWTDKPTTPWNSSQSTTNTWWTPPNSSPSTTTTATNRPITPGVISTPAPSAPSAPGSLAGSACSTGDHHPDPANCGTYYRCVLGELKREYCAPGLHWDASRMLCDWPAAAKCQKRPSTANAPLTTKRPTFAPNPTKPTPAAMPSVPTIGQRPDGKDCEHGQYYAYPNSCTHFLICVNGKLVKQQCGPGLNWNSAKNMCDWAFKNPCNDTKKMMFDSLKDGSGKSCTAGQYSSVPGDCESYYACLWGKFEEFQCAPGLHFNAESNICDWPSRAKCEDGNGGAVGEVPLDPVGTDPGAAPIAPTTQRPKPSSTALPSAEVDPDKISPLSGHFKVVCYFTNWAWYRRGVGRYLPEHIDHTLCTHIVYGFAVLDYSNLIIKAHDSWADYDNRFYERVVTYKKRGVKVSLALGGWNDSAGDKYSRLVNNPAARRKFVEQALQFVEKYGFDGLDLDWEYPVCWQTDCNKGPSSDKEAFSDLVRELSEQFKPRGLLLSTAVSPSKKIIDAGYDVPLLARYFDWIAVMTYDYHGQWDKRTGHVAPMYYHPDDEFYYFNANYTINYWIAKGAPPRSIVMGMPLYGQAFSINDPKRGTGLNSPASAGTAGEFTKAAGFLAYYEICDRIRNKGWQVVQDPQRRMGPYAFKGNQWVSFDDADMIRQKAQFVRDMGLGGGMVWALDLDDFRGRCGEGKHPLMHTLQQVLAEPPNKHDRPINPPKIGQDLEWRLSEPPNKNDITNLQFKEETEEYKVVCYFTNWAWYRQSGGKFVPEDIDPDLCSHIVYGFAVLDGTSLTIKPHDSWADLDNKFYERVVAYKAKGKKVLIAIGGWNDSLGDKYSRLVNNPAARKAFIAHVIKFIEKYGFDGLDLDWEYPVCWQVDCTKGPKTDKEGFAQWVVELSAELKPRGLLLSSAVSPNHRVITEGYDVPVLAEHLDWIAVMTYDYHGQWDKKTGHNAPFYARPDDWDKTFNANYSIHYWMERGAPPKKLVMGVPLYGQSFSLAERGIHGLNAPTYGGGEAGDNTRARGFLAYYEICQRTLRNDWTVVQDPERRIGPYAYKGDQWVSFDDAAQVRRKSEYIKELGLGGGMVWALDLDDFKNFCGCEPSPLLRTMNRVLRNYPAGPLCPVTTNAITETQPSTIKPTTESPNYEPSTASTPCQPSSSEIPVEVPTEEVDTVEVEAGGSPPPPSAYPQGSCHDKLFIADRKDCRKYYLCNFGQLTELTCPSGLYWNEGHCDWPENTKCEGKKKIQYNTSSFISIVKVLTNSLKSNEVQEPTKVIQTTTERTYESEESLEELTIGGRKIICYYTNWSVFRLGIGTFEPEDIDPNICTHIVYLYAVLDSDSNKVKPGNYLADIDNNMYSRVIALKKKGIKVLISVGGYAESRDVKYSNMVKDDHLRALFVSSALELVEKYGFSGLDINWDYPVCWKGYCSDQLASDKEGYTKLVQELSEKLRPRNLLLSATVSPDVDVIEKGYDVPAIMPYLDWISVLSLDYHSHSDGKTGLNAPLYYSLNDEYDFLNVNVSVQYWLTKGAPASKLVLGIPTYGQSFTLKNPIFNKLNAPVSGLGKAGEFTKSEGILAYYEICRKVKEDRWTIRKDPEGSIGTYATGGDQWVSYDSTSDFAKKADYIKEWDLAGGMIWALDLDDFKNTCGCGKYPLLNTFATALKGDTDQLQDCV